MLLFCTHIFVSSTFCFTLIISSFIHIDNCASRPVYVEMIICRPKKNGKKILDYKEEIQVQGNLTQISVDSTEFFIT